MTAVDEVRPARKIGGSARPTLWASGSSLGLQAEDVRQTIRKIKSGLSYETLTRFQRVSQFPLETIAEAVQIPRRTLARRRASGKLTKDESERLLRLSLLFEKAVNLFEGDTAAARKWLEAPNRALGGESPLSTAETEIGAREVEDVIGRLEHGVFA